VGWCFLGDVARFRLQVFPELLGQRNIGATRQAFHQHGLQPGVFFFLLGLAQQRAEILAHIAVALGGHLTVDEGLQGFWQGDGKVARQ